MKAAVMKDTLKDALGTTERVATKSLSLPILSNVLLRIQKTTVQLSATDLQMGIIYEFLGDSKEEGEVVFPAKLLYPLLSVVSEQQVVLETEGQHLNIISGGYRASINTVDAEDFPIIPTPKGDEQRIDVEASVLCKGINQVAGMAGQSQARPEISGVLFVFEKEILKIVATDSFRLAEKKIRFEHPNQIEASFILPQKTAREVVAVFGEREGRVSIYFSPSQVVFDYGVADQPGNAHIQIVSRVIDGEYPNYQDVIPTGHKTKIRVNKEAFTNHVKAASVFAGKTNEVRVVVDGGKKEVEFLSQNNEAGQNRSTLEAEITGDRGEAAFNWRFLQEGLSQIKGENIEFDLNGEEGPALLRATEQDGYIYVIMPIKA